MITGFGRIGGAWFASSKFGLEPDLVTCAKGLTSGYAPMGAVLVAPRVWEPFFGPEPGVWLRHGYTYSGHAASRRGRAGQPRGHRAGGPARRGGPAGDHARATGSSPLAEIDGVAEVRCGTGALAAVQLADPADAMALAKRLRAFGVATRAVGAGGIQVSPRVRHDRRPRSTTSPTAIGAADVDRPDGFDRSSAGASSGAAP